MGSPPARVASVRTHRTRTFVHRNKHLQRTQPDGVFLDALSQFGFVLISRKRPR